MRGRSGMAAQRAGVADIDQSFDKLERIVEFLGGLETACDAESEQRGSPPTKILARERVVRAIAEAGVVDPRDAGVDVQKLRNLACIFDVALHAERNRFNAQQNQEGAHGRQNCTGGALIDAARSGDESFSTEPVDARAVPASLTGLRTIFNGFHHLRPEDARSVLHAAAAARQPIAIFEISERSPRTIPVVLTPLMVWLVTPFMRPFLWRRLLWTYLIPLVPFTCFWDGIVSQLRAYTLDELRGLSAGSAPMHWHIGQVPFAGGRGRLTYLIGVPA